MGRYRSFSAMQAHEREGIDYRVDVIDQQHEVTIVAPHGGIEPYTISIAHLLRDGTRNGYFFRAFTDTSSDNWHSRLHIPSTRYDDGRLVSLLGRSKICISVHGWPEPSETIYVGGRDDSSVAPMIAALCKRGFHAQDARQSDLPIKGIHPRNFINRPHLRGVQLEFCKGIREKMQKEQMLKTELHIAVNSAIYQILTPSPASLAPYTNSRASSP